MPHSQSPLQTVLIQSKPAPGARGADGDPANPDIGGSIGQITAALITGAFANRVTFKSYLLFLVAWLLLLYFPVADMVWGGGILQHKGVLDFAGGIVVHATAGFAALAAVFYVGKRRVADAGLHSIPLVALGTGLLWFGWYGFNAGSEQKVDTVTSLAFFNIDVGASFAAMTWLVLAWTSLFGEGLVLGRIGGAATTAHYVDGGITLLLSSKLQADIRIGHGLGVAVSTERYVGAGLAWRW